MTAINVFTRSFIVLAMDKKVAVKGAQFRCAGMSDKEAKEARKLHDKYVEEERKEENRKNNFNKRRGSFRSSFARSYNDERSSGGGPVRGNPQCFKCKKWGHVARDCYANKGGPAKKFNSGAGGGSSDGKSG